MEKTIKIDTVDTYNSLYGLETLHPLVTVVDLRKATKSINNIKMDYGVYALFLKNSVDCQLRYGRKPYDYQKGTITSFAPGQVVEVMMLNDQIGPDVRGIVFHPDLIRGTSLGQNIKKYGFFAYSSSEALHLSEREQAIVEDCLTKIQCELEHAIDKHSRGLIAMNIELLLNYCLRFYERQFITREVANRGVIERFEGLIDDYYDADISKNEGLPSVKYFADKVCLSANYFGDLVKKETGKSAQEYIQSKIIERSKDLIMSQDYSISEVAYQLGFAYPQHFNRLFKKQVGVTPRQYKMTN